MTEEDPKQADSILRRLLSIQEEREFADAEAPFFPDFPDDDQPEGCATPEEGEDEGQASHEGRSPREEEEEEGEYDVPTGGLDPGVGLAPEGTRGNAVPKAAATRFYVPPHQRVSSGSAGGISEGGI